MPTTAVIVQARLGSSRLPAKVLLPLPTGRTVLEEVLYRCQQISGVDKVVLAIPDTEDNDVLAKFIDERINNPWDLEPAAVVVRGPEHDVLARYVKAAEAVKADVVMRITSDCPLIDPKQCALTLGAFIPSGADYVANNFEPRSIDYGLDCEVFTAKALRCAAERATDPSDREHVGQWMRTNLNALAKSNVISPGWTPRRITLDTLADYVTIWSVFEQQMREAA